MQEFRNRCREFIDCLVDVLLETNLSSSDFLQGVHAFCPEILLEGNDRYILRLFCKFVLAHEKSGSLSSEQLKSGAEEIVIFVVDDRLLNVACENSAEGIADVISYLLADYRFLSRKHLCRIFK